MSNLSDFLGGGGVETGQVVETVASTLGGLALLELNSQSFNPATYPTLATLLPEANSVGPVSEVIEPTNSASHVNLRCHAGSETNDVVAAFQQSSPGANYDFTARTDAYGASTEITSDLSNFIPADTQKASVSMSDDGSVICGVAQQTNKVITTFYRQASGNIVSTASTFTSASNGMGSPIIAVSGDGSIVFVAAQISSSPDVEFLYSSTPQSMTAFTTGSDSGITDGEFPVGLATDGDGSVVYMMVTGGKLYSKNAPYNSGVWTTVASGITFPGGVTPAVGEGRMFSSSDGTLLMFANGSTISGFLEFVIFSDDSGATWTELALTGTANNAFGTEIDVEIISALQRRNGDVDLVIERTDTTGAKSIELTRMLAADRAGDWLTTNYTAPGTFSENNMVFTGASTAPTSNLDTLIHRPSDDAGIFATVRYDVQSNLYISGVDRGHFVPTRIDKKIVAGE